MDGLKVSDYEVFYELLTIYDKELAKNIKNKNKLYYFEKNKMQNIVSSFNVIKNNYLSQINYNIFYIKEPKLRIIMSLNVKDKLINHYVSKNILENNLTKYLIDKNIATRKGMGVSYGINLIKKYLEKNKKYSKFYILKIDISKYFYNIDHLVLFDMLKDKLSANEYQIIKNIINSTNKLYINEKIIQIRERLENYEIPLYSFNKGLPIGNMTSQFLAIFYLHELDHYIVHNLHINCYVRYMDDFILIHHNKELLKESLIKIANMLNDKYKLSINKNKTKLNSSKEGFSFLGYNYKVVNNKTIIKINRSTYKKMKENIKKKHNQYLNNEISFNEAFSSVMTYYNSYKYNKEKARRYIDKVWFNNEK